MTDPWPHILPDGNKRCTASRAVLVHQLLDRLHFDLPCEYLRIHSHAAEVRAMGRPEVGKENVTSNRIEPQGSYAVAPRVRRRPRTRASTPGRRSHDLGVNHDRYWAEYLQKLEAAGHRRAAGAAAGQPRRARLLYFAYLAQYLRR